MEFPRQEYWSGLPLLPPGHLPNKGIEPASPAWQTASLPLSHLGSPLDVYWCLYVMQMLSQDKLGYVTVINNPKLQWLKTTKEDFTLTDTHQISRGTLLFIITQGPKLT